MNKYRTVEDPVYFQWKLPSMPEATKYLLCSGWIKNNYSSHIIPPIIKLCAEFYTNDDYSLNQILNANNGEAFCSPIFGRNSLKWYLCI